MIQILKYIFFLVLGIIIFVLYSNVDNFSVGIPYLQLGHPDNPTELNTYGPDTDLFFTLEDIVDIENPNIFYFDLARYGLVPGQNYILITDDIIDRIIEDNQDNPNFEIIRDILNRIRRNNRLPFTDNRNRNSGGGLGLPPDMTPPRPGGSLWLDLSVNEPPGLSVGSANSGLFQRLTSCASAQWFDEDITPNIQDLYILKQGDITKDVLESIYGYIFREAIVTQGYYRLYDVNHDDTIQQDELRDRLEEKYSQSGNSHPNYAIRKIYALDDSETLKLYYLTYIVNGVEYLVARALITIRSDIVELSNITTLPPRYGFGTKLMELLAILRTQTTTIDPDYMRQISIFYPLCIKPYRDMFRNSLNWPKLDEELFSIFNPDSYKVYSGYSKMMDTLYFSNEGDYDRLYNYLYTVDNINNRSYYNLFLMGLNEVTIQTYLNNPQNFLIHLRELYIAFLQANGFPNLD